MRIEWYGQSAFRLTGATQTVVIDPFGDLTAATAGRLRFEYPPVDAAPADLVLVTHEHADHNAVEAIGGTPVVLRSTAGRLESPIGEIVAIASEHDTAAGTERGPNTIFVLELDGLRIAHFGDFGQSALRPEQAAAIGSVDVLLIPVGGGPTIGDEAAAAITAQLAPRWVLPMHYRTNRIDFLEPADAFIARMPQAARLPAGPFALPDAAESSVVVVPDAP
ncbi:MAG TPA: MBL fold metallo-hydrolase [Solirubrobacteraceae bacterium]|jgi:L-ascorbate metabolism protein UlaG (beta-lactamase superfamily)|nr:MBL fold metallo-hydrolase [Solirubrobacteraceae bacterium]